jgi:serine/threonine protein kinase
MDRLREHDPETIGPYKLIARLGAGGMGIVFLGTKGVERAAIKVVRNTFLDDPSLKARFVREIDTLSKISSPYVARIIDSSTEADLAWHAVEFVNGPTLRELISSGGPLAEEDWWQLAQQLTDGLDSFHQLGIVHRDIKPSNIIMSETGPKIIDFGIAQDDDATSLTMTGAVAGSPAWLSPEQLEGSEITSGSDLYSLGSVLVFAATGKSPWGDDTSMSVPVVYQKILSGASDLNGLSESQRATVEALQDTHPGSRRFIGKASKHAPKKPRDEKTRVRVPPPAPSLSEPNMGQWPTDSPAIPAPNGIPTFSGPQKPSQNGQYSPRKPLAREFPMLDREEWEIIAETEFWSDTPWRSALPISVTSLESINPSYVDSLHPFDRREAKIVFAMLDVDDKLLWHVCGQPDLTLALVTITFDEWLRVLNPDPIEAWRQAGSPPLRSWTTGPFGAWLGL